MIEECAAFRKFTLWSQHLILYTQRSLKTLVEGRSAFVVERAEGVQRYPLANHFGWLLDGAPGGHERRAQLRTATLDREYERMLQSIDRTDTIIAYLRK